MVASVGFGRADGHAEGIREAVGLHPAEDGCRVVRKDCVGIHRAFPLGVREVDQDEVPRKLGVTANPGRNDLVCSEPPPATRRYVAPRFLDGRDR